MDDQIRVGIYGDSIMKVVTPAEGFHYHSIAGQFIDDCAKRFGLDIANRSRFGSTVTQGYERLVADLARGQRYDYVVLEYGGNDCDYDWKSVAESPDVDHDPHTPIERFLATYESMVDKVISEGMSPILMTLPPMDAKRYLDYISRTGFSAQHIVQWLGDSQMIYRFQEFYSDAVKDLAHRLELPLMDIRRSFLDKHNYSDLVSSDGAHPSPSGYALIFETIGNYIARLRDTSIGTPCVG